MNPQPPMPPSESQQCVPTLSAGLGEPGRQQAILGPTALLIIFHDEHVIMSFTRNNQFGITTLMS